MASEFDKQKEALEKQKSGEEFVEIGSDGRVIPKGEVAAERKSVILRDPRGEYSLVSDKAKVSK